jgi:hypothetical protein
VTDPTVAQTSLGRVEIEFGLNRWVMVAIESNLGQQQVGSARELGAYLQRRGLVESEARDLARTAWRSRPRDADTRSGSPDESLLSATGLSSGAVLVLVITFVVIFTVAALYAATHWPESY